mgnify:CR=1 FL=1
MVGLIVLVKSTHNNYLYMKYYIFLLPYIFLFFWEYITTFSFRVKNKNYSLTESKKNILNKISCYGSKSENLKKTVLFISEREK